MTGRISVVCPNHGTISDHNWANSILFTHTESYKDVEIAKRLLPTIEQWHIMKTDCHSSLDMVTFDVKKENKQQTLF